MISLRYCFDTEPMADFPALCAQFAGKPLQSPFRSTVPLLSLIEHSRQQWNALLDSLGEPPDGVVHFEYRVPSPKPRGNPSQTDALIISDSTILAVEAKWTEPRYETVAKRLSKPESDGADPRLTVNGWLQHLQPFAASRLDVEDVKDVVYQVLHRAASACAVATTSRCRPLLMYLHFHPSPLQNSATTDQYISDLRQLNELLGHPAKLKFVVAEIPLAPTLAFESLKDLDKRSQATSALVIEALCHGPLFTFGTPIITRI